MKKRLDHDGRRPPLSPGQASTRPSRDLPSQRAARPDWGSAALPPSQVRPRPTEGTAERRRPSAPQRPMTQGGAYAHDRASATVFRPAPTRAPGSYQPQARGEAFLPPGAGHRPPRLQQPPRRTKRGRGLKVGLLCLLLIGLGIGLWPMATRLKTAFQPKTEAWPAQIELAFQAPRFNPAHHVLDRLPARSFQRRLLQAFDEAEAKEGFDAKAISIYDLDTSEERVIFGQARAVTPASITKLFTIEAARRLLPIDATVRVDQATLDLIKPDSSLAGYRPGLYTIQQLIEGMMLPSGNDAAYALAVAAGRQLLYQEQGQEGLLNQTEADALPPAKEAMARFMSYLAETLQQMGCRDSHISDASG